MRYHFENAYAEYRIKAGILFLYYKPQNCLTLQAAKKVVQDRLTVQIDKAYPVYCDVRYIIDSEKAARDYLYREGAALTKAVAFRVSDPVSESMLQFYLQRSNTQIPTRICYDKKTAVSFLENYISPKSR